MQQSRVKPAVFDVTKFDRELGQVYKVDFESSVFDSPVFPCGKGSAARGPDPAFSAYLDVLGQRNAARREALKWRKQALVSWGFFMAACAVIVWGLILPAVLRLF